MRSARSRKSTKQNSFERDKWPLKADGKTRSWHWIVAFSGVFGFLLLWRFGFLQSPPYWDAATGPWTYAAYLADSGFDYAGLSLARTKAESPAPASTIAPTFLAILMHVAPRLTIPISHLLTFAAAAVVVILIVAILRRRTGWGAAIVLALLVLFTPLFSAQVEQLDTQVPMCALGLASLFVLSRGRWLASALLAGLAVVVDIAAIGLIVGATLFLAYLWWSSRKVLLRPLIAYVGLLLFALWIAWGYFSASPPRDPGLYNVRMGSWLYIARFWTPDVALWIAISLSAGGSLWMAGFQLSRPAEEEFDAAKFAWCGLVASVIWHGFGEVMPADLLLLVALATVVFGAVFLSHGRLRVVGWSVAVAMLAFNIINQHGRFYSSPSILHGPEYARTGSVLSRSLEYRTDHKANIDAVQAIVEDANGEVIVVAEPLSNFLALPRLGYVEESVPGISLRPVVQAEPKVISFRSVITAWPPNAVFVVAANRYYHDSPPLVITGPTQDDEVLYRSESPAPLIVFRRSNDRGSESMAAEWVFERFLMYTTVYQRVMAQAVILEHGGNIDRAIKSLEKELKYSPRNAEVRIALAKLLIKKGRTDRAREELALVLQEAPDHADANLQVGILCLQQSRFDEAVSALKKSLESSPEQDDVLFYLAAAYAQLGQLEASINHLAKAAQIAPTNANYPFNLGLLYVQQGNREMASEQLRKALRLNPDFPEARQQLQQLGFDE